MPRILIVEDSPDIAEWLRQLVRHAGAVCEWAPTGETAMALYWWAIAQKSPYDGIVMDLAVPGVDGLSLSERIRGIEREGIASRCRIFGFTGYPHLLLSEEAVKRADLDMLRAKPGEAQEIRDWVNSLGPTDAAETEQAE